MAAPPEKKSQPSVLQLRQGWQPNGVARLGWTSLGNVTLASGLPVEQPDPDRQGAQRPDAAGRLAA